MSMRLPFFNNKKTKLNETPELDTIPKHVAIIMDGNGRWAKKRGLPRVAGHKEGMDVVRQIAKVASKCQVEILTLYAFSTENWRRPKSEVDYLLRLPKEFLHIYLPELMENNIKIETMGYVDMLPDHTKEAVDYAKEKTKDNDGLILNFALNYGSRFEILQAVKHIITDMENDELSLDKLDEQRFSEYLYTTGLAEPEDRKSVV